MIRLSKSVIGEKEKANVLRILDEEFLGMGTEVKLFESELTEFFNRPAICVSSGTAAIHLALQAAGIGLGDEVLVQSLTYLASYQAISATGAKPVSCDINADNFTINLNDAERKVTAKTKAVLLVHYAGNVGDMESVYAFARKYNIRVIEDAAHAFGTIYQNKLVGNFGDIVCFSFDGIKNITSGEGGAIVSEDHEILNKISDLRLLAVRNDAEKRYKNKRSWDISVTEQGWRYHMSNIMAAIGRVQLSRFESFKQARQSLAKRYKTNLKDCKKIKLLDINYQEVVPHIFVVRLIENNRDVIREILLSKGIQTGVHYKPNHLLDFYKDDNVKLPVTEEIYKQILTLPLHPDLTYSDIDKVCNTLKDLLYE